MPFLSKSMGFNDLHDVIPGSSARNHLSESANKALSDFGVKSMIRLGPSTSLTPYFRRSVLPIIR